MRDHHLGTTRARGSLVAVVLLLTGGVSTLGAGPAASLAPVQDTARATSTTSQPPRVTPDAAERRIASCMLRIATPAVAADYEAWTTRCRAQVAAGKM